MAEILQVNWRYAPGPEARVGEGAKYKLRLGRRGRRGEEEEGEEGRKVAAGAKVKAGKGMSKYRRKTANARERMRMGEINTAFDKLKERIPLPSVGLGRQKCEKLTKINLLHIAINYIRTLEDILETGEEDVDICPDKLILNPFHEAEEVEEEEEEMEEVATLRSSSVAFSPTSVKREASSSPDSGIQEDEGDPEFPDWTQLSSTLDLRQEVRRVTLPTAPALAPDAFALHLEAKTKSKPVTLTSRNQVQKAEPTHLPATPLLLHCKASLLCSKELEEEEEEELFLPDICTNLDTTFHALGGIDFAYDDPFKVF